MFAVYQQLPPPPTGTPLPAPSEVFRSDDGTPLDPAQMLKRFRVPSTLQEAVDYLQGLVDSVGMLGLYIHYFPDEYNASTSRLFPRNGEVYSEREQEFFRLLNERKFPIQDDWLDDERQSLIPVWPFGFEWENVSDLSPGWHFMMLLAGEFPRSRGVQEADAWEWWQESLVDFLGEDILEELRNLPRTRDLAESLRVRCATEEGPMKRTLQAFHMMYHSTGLCWLDADHEYAMFECVWDKAEIDWLAEEYPLSMKYYREVEEFINWLEASPNNMLEAAAWMTDVVGDPEGAPIEVRERMRVGTMTAEQFVQGNFADVAWREDPEVEREAEEL